ncbi:MAG TPA: PIN domain-containing protein [Acidimicrobiia bacterium]|nr:PIN domain-containing protein [Acidimicrobiia bacterium]
MIVDTSGLLAYFNRREPLHHEAVSAVEAADELIVSPYVVAEVDYLVMTRHGVEAELNVLDELSGGAWVQAEFGDPEIRQARSVIARYPDQRIGVTDASLVVLAHRHRTHELLSLDRRHFDVIRPLGGGRFRLRP